MTLKETANEVRNNVINIVKENKHRAIPTLVGAGIGTAIGVALTPAQMAMDACAPISYPIWGVISGVFGTSISIATSKDFSLKAIGTSLAINIPIGVATASLCIPMAPSNMIHRPVSTPITNGIIGAGIGFFFKEIIESIKIL